MTAWEDLAATALLGTQRRTPDLAALPGPLGEAARALDATDQARALLDAAALAAPYRRAGRKLATYDADPVVRAPEETAPAVGAAAGDRLAQLLAAPLAQGNRALLLEWAGAARGRRAPYEALPALLDAGVRDRELATAVAPLLGERGRWLARFRPEWQRVVTTAAAHAAPATVDVAVWETGDAAGRRELFAALRRTDPAAARDLLAGSWAQEKGDDREAFLDLLDVGLSPGDEPLLEAALDDRRKGVRDRAAALLQRLPASAYGRRMAARATAAVRLEKRMLRSRLVVTPPAAADEGMPRDGITAKPPQGTGEQAWLLRQVVAATPLSVWADATGLSPEQLLAVNVDGGWRGELLAGWLAATTIQRDPRWARALLDAGAPAEWLPDLLAVTDPAHRAAVVARVVKAQAANAATLLATVPGPWPDVLADGVAAWLAKPGGPNEWVFREVLSLAAHRLPPRRAADVAELARRLPDGSAWRPALTRAAETLTFRHDMLEELR